MEDTNLFESISPVNKVLEIVDESPYCHLNHQLIYVADIANLKAIAVERT